MTKKLKVAVGSTNPVKIKCVELAFKAVWPGKIFEFTGISVGSEISNQPMSDEESIQGARNRARKALNELTSDFGVGLEGGLQKIKGIWFTNGWIVVVNKKGLEGIGSTIRVETPSKVVNMINKGLELGDVIDKLFKGENLKQKQGYFGLLTNNLITRTTGYKDGVISALARFIHPEIF